MTTTDQTPTPLDLDAIRARVDAATDGPWWADECEIHTASIPHAAVGEAWVAETIAESEPDQARANAAFIAAARSDVPRLADELIEVRIELDYQRQMRANYDELHADQVEQLRAELAEARATIATLRRAADEAAALASLPERGGVYDHPEPVEPDSLAEELADRMDALDRAARAEDWATRP